MTPLAVVLLILVTAGVVCAGWCARFLIRLERAMQALGQGDLTIRLPSTEGGRFRRVAKAVNMAAAALERQRKGLEAAHRSLQAILDSMIEGVVALDREGRILWLNGSAARFLEVTASQALGKRFTELFRQPEAEALLHDVAQQRSPASREIRTAALQERVVQVQAVPCDAGRRQAPDPDEAAGAPEAALVLVIHDVTSMRRFEGMRREFVANVSHELKTPLTSIKGLTETLLGGALEDPAANRRFVTMIEQDATRLSRLVDDLLELSHIESKALPLRRQPVALRALIESVVSGFQHPLQARQITVDNAVAEALPVVRADPERLRQVFVNLIDNAVKFNAVGGRILLRAAIDGAQLRIDVEDTGIGIPEADLPRIFERFYRVDNARSRERGGTGLGLSIVKHLIEAHGGTVAVASRLHHGTTVSVTLPYEP